MKFEHVLYEKGDKCTWITINHPERLNSFDAETILDLTNAIEMAALDRLNAAIVITGAGDKAFCAGGFLKDLTDMNPERGRFLFGQTIRCTDAMRRAPMPVIAAVNGWAMGGGNELVIAADFAIASEHAKLGQTGPKVGSAPVFGATNLMALNCGEKRAKEISMMCKQYTAQECYELGWINRVVPHAQLRTEVQHWVDELSERAPSYIELCKVTSNVWWDMLSPMYQHAQQTLIRLAGSPEMREGASAFVEKRKPNFHQFREALAAMKRN